MVNIFSKLFGASKPADQPQTREAAAPKAPEKAREAVATADQSDINLNGFVEYVVKSLVMYPDEVFVTSEVDDQGLLIRIRCNPEEVGRIIGKSGKTIRAIRSLVKGAAARQSQKASVIVMED